MKRVSRTGPEAKLVRFHPVRFYLMRDDDLWADMVERHIADMKVESSLSLLGVGERLYFSHRAGNNLLRGLEPYTFHEDRLKKAFGEEYGSSGNVLEMAVMDWFESGQQIFDLSAISAMFLGSDALKTPVGRLNLPYESFYVHWGRHLELPSPMSGRFIEGCYVDRYPTGEIDLTFISSLPDNDPWDQRSLLANMVVDCEGVYAVMLDVDSGGSIGEESMASMETGSSNEPGVLRWTPYIKQAINMIANCLCYLSSAKAEIEDSFPPEAPERLVKQATTGTPRERRRGESKLQSLGFRMIKLCGRKLAVSLDIKPGSKEMPPHWRKGHWWPARVGKGRAEVRMDWREGVVVNKDKGTPQGGHVYKA
ncbi:hypothetical protein [Ralstonia pseudosolanacearum]|uniref:hypothetical protein n=1 Tax=Ralstonia pseudosolanacearum TaxID=1310165 RepID=UPI003CF8DB8D